MMEDLYTEDGENITQTIYKKLDYVMAQEIDGSLHALIDWQKFGDVVLAKYGKDVYIELCKEAELTNPEK